MKTLSLFCVFIMLAFTPAHAQDWRAGAGYLELADRLDRPQDGYCLDVAGSGAWVDFAMPLNAHNCKGPDFFADGAVVFSSPGPIRFPAYEGCVTAVGLKGRSLPGAALMLKPCARGTGDSPFIHADLQRFIHRPDGRIELGETGLCIAVGARSDSTFSPDHRWRALFMADCENAALERSIWKPFAPRR